VNYIELFGYPLSGKTTLIKSFDESCSIKCILARTDKNLLRALVLIRFLLIHRYLVLLFLRLPIRKNNLFPSLRKFLSFTARYKDYLKLQNSSDRILIDEGLCQGIWGLLTFYDYADYKKDLPKLVKLFFDRLLINNNILVAQMPKVPLDVFERRSLKRDFHHPYIISRLNGHHDKLVIYNYCYELILIRVRDINSLITIQDLTKYAN